MTARQKFFARKCRLRRQRHRHLLHRARLAVSPFYTVARKSQCSSITAKMIEAFREQVHRPQPPTDIIMPVSMFESLRAEIEMIKRERHGTFQIPLIVDPAMPSGTAVLVNARFEKRVLIKKVS